MIFEIMSPYDLPEYIGKTKAVIIDIREYNEFIKGHIPTAKHYSCFEVDEMLEGNINVFDSYDNIIVYCNHGTSSMKIALELCLRINKISKRDGIVYSLYGGIENYSGMKIENKDFRENVLTK